MVVRSLAAPPTPWSKKLAEPKINQTAYVHSFSNVIGDVYIDANVFIAPGTSVRADEGSPFHIGKGTNIQDGVVIHGLEQGRVLGDDQNKYSVWIGSNASITHMALIHGPAYIGEDCFIGFRSTVFNARVGKGCIVMMHALVQDVEIPPGKYVSSGSVISNQQQADRLPNVQESDIQFASHVVGINDALRSGYHCAENIACIAPIRDEDSSSFSGNGYDSDRSSSRSSESTHLSSEAIEQVRQLLEQGYQIGTEHADKRRFRTSSWQSCAPIQGKRESEVIAALDECLAGHEGEYVRMFGIDPQAQKRVMQTIIQHPNGQPTSAQRSKGQSAKGQTSQRSSQSSSSAASSSRSSSRSSESTHLSSEAIEQVRQLLEQGYQIGTEHADKRRFRTSSWQSCAPIQAKRESEVIAALDECLAGHEGEYVRMFGIDPQAQKRVMQTIIQHPNGQPTSAQRSKGQTSQRSSQSSSSAASSSRSSSRSSESTHLSSEAIEQVRQLLEQGYQIGTEHADKRRFRTSSWQSCAPIQAKRESEVIAALDECLAGHEGEYVRMFGIDPQAQKRVMQTIIQHPGS